MEHVIAKPGQGAGAHGHLRWILPVLCLLAGLHLWLNGGMPPAGPWWQQQDIASLQFYYASLPRMVMALLAGAALGLSGSVLQQLSGNRLVSPMTLGISSGAWLGVVLAAVALPDNPSLSSGWPALLGAMLALGLDLLLTGPRGLNGLPLVLAGMAVNLLLGGMATMLVLLHDQYASNLFVWGAGDLAQIDWQWAQWLWPRLLPAALLLWLAPRPLAMLSLGVAAARGRGLALGTILLLLLAALWLSAVTVSAVGLIGFIGLLAPNLAQLLGARRPLAQLACSALLGAACLLGSDCLALAIGHWAGSSLPSGAVTALLGGPLLLWLVRRSMNAAQHTAMLQIPGSQRQWRKRNYLLLLGALLGLCWLSIALAPGPDGWQWQWPDALLWSLRWPRSLVALSAGAGLALAGVLLQRLLRNPLASPDLLGLSAGSTLCMLLVAACLGRSLLEDGILFALLGALLVLAALLWLGRRQQYAPGMMALSGIALAAMLDAMLQTVLAKGTPDSLAVLAWLSGSSYRVTPAQAMSLGLAVLLLAVLALACQRVLTLLGLGDGLAQGRGPHLAAARLGLLLLVAVLTAAVTAVLGPVAFLGLLAPHIASMLGARQAATQLLVAALLGAGLLLLADWLGRVVIYPRQLPLGMLASVLCGCYFLLLLGWQRLRRGGGQ